MRYSADRVLDRIGQADEGQIDDLIAEIKAVVEKGQRVLITTY